MCNSAVDFTNKCVKFSFLFCRHATVLLFLQQRLRCNTIRMRALLALSSWTLQYSFPQIQCCVRVFLLSHFASIITSQCTQYIHIYQQQRIHYRFLKTFLFVSYFFVFLFLSVFHSVCLSVNSPIFALYQTIQRHEKNFSSKVEWQNGLKATSSTYMHRKKTTVTKSKKKKQQKKNFKSKKTTEKKRARNCNGIYCRLYSIYNSLMLNRLLSFSPTHCFTAAHIVLFRHHGQCELGVKRTIVCTSLCVWILMHTHTHDDSIVLGKRAKRRLCRAEKLTS